MGHSYTRVEVNKHLEWTTCTMNGFSFACSVVGKGKIHEHWNRTTPDLINTSGVYRFLYDPCANEIRMLSYIFALMSNENEITTELR